MRLTILRQGRVWALCFVMLLLGVMEARADIQIGDNLTVTGFFRQMFAVHTGNKNPNNVNQEDNNWLNLSRTLFQTEWTYRPSRALKIFGKLRIIHDQTDMWDSNLDDYNAFPLSTTRYGTYLRPTDDDNFAAELWELYADLSLGNLWLRLGKQQIAWGEMIGGRIMEIINPLDFSWHLMLEPEEFENIRVPLWSVRGMYNIEQLALPWLKDTYIEGFLNPGNIVPQINPEPGSPFNLKSPTPPIFDLHEKDRWGDLEYGFRLAGRIGQLFGTLNYLHLYTDGGYWETKGFIPPFYTEIEYPSTDVYGLTLNYSFAPPLDMTVTFEGTYTPDQPYYDAASALPKVKEVGTWKHAIRFDRKTFVLPRPISAMNIQLQFSQAVVEDADDVKMTPAPLDRDINKIDTTSNTIALIFRQDLWYNNIVASLKLINDLDGAYYIIPGFKYRYGNDWYFEIYGTALGGSDRRVGKLGYMYWADEIYARITYQF